MVYTTFHFPESGANVITTDNADWATDCPEYKVTAVQLSKVTEPSEWQKRQAEFSKQQEGFRKGKRAGKKKGERTEREKHRSQKQGEPFP